MAELSVAFAQPKRVGELGSGLPKWALDDRLEALKLFESTPLELSPLFHRHVITEGAPLDAVDLAPVPGRVPLAGGPPPSLGIEATVEIVDGAVRGLALSTDSYDAGVTFLSIAEAVQEKDPKTQELLTYGPTKQSDKFFRLTQALYQDGVVLDVPAGVQLRRPIRVILRQRNTKLAAFTRVVVRLGKGARAEIVESQFSDVDGPGIQGVATEAIVGEDAVLRYAAVGNFGTSVGTYLNRQAVVEARGAIHWSLGNFGAAYVKSKTMSVLEGDGASVHHAEVVFGAKSQRFDISSFATHIGKGTKSDLLAKAALRQKSRANVKGMILITPQGINTDSILGQFALLLDPEARSIAIPGLEIETSQVIRAKHAASVQQLDETQVFYLKSRGIPEQIARRLIVEGFLHPVVAALGAEELQAEAHKLIQSKWA